MPLGAWFFDLLENIIIVVLVSGYPSQPMTLGWLLFMFRRFEMAVCLCKRWIAAGWLNSAARNWFKVSDRLPPPRKRHDHPKRADKTQAEDQ